MQTKLIYSLLILITILAGCAGNDVKEDDPTKGWTARQLYKEAKKKLEIREFSSAIELFETLESRYPFGKYTQQAQLEIAYSYYKQDEFDNAILAVDQFIKLHPQHESIDYAYYLKGLSNFSRGQSTMERMFPRHLSKVDQNWLKSAFADFDTLVQRYPSSRYVQDAKQRMLYLRNEMAHHEYINANYYFRRGAMVATINRVKYLLEHFDQTPYTNDALALMARAYTVMGKPELANQTLEILSLNDPNHEMLKNQ